GALRKSKHGINPPVILFLRHKIWPVGRVSKWAGRPIDEAQTEIEHSGGNPNFATQVTMFPKEGIGISLLANSAAVNLVLVNKTKGVLDGGPEQTYA
ncbi:MAG TPA: hypothetical protein GX528_06440, partial [Firmicutes bacterium]|nr:hypothetical protein [Bacillota bacterium]